MSEVLSQNEIDNLLAALNTGELDVDQMSAADEKKVKDYDFKRPAKFSKEHLRTLEMIYEHYGRLLSTTLPLYLRKNVQVSVANSETVTYSEFSNALSNPVILGIINFLPLQGTIILELQANIGFAFIDRMLGGEGVGLDKTRPFTDIEMPLIEKLITICMQLMVEPWENVLAINPIMERIETNPQFAQVISPTDMIAIVTLNIKIGDVEGLMNICLPYFTLESVMDKLNTKFWFSTMQKHDDDTYGEHLESLVRHVDVPVKAILGKCNVSVSDFVQLQRGDIIRLDNQVNSELQVYVGDIYKFTAMPGTAKDKYAVKITSVIREEEE
ncbi:MULTISPECIES: flagellar motor switch protein FliM [unclassified Butyrivibrio]|uniref:flagellar motor switch protein FliM n=1 Tax=unclassified Butyrivibrio TaxID=2639466 RepID=UPI0003F4FFFA|nr:MULTISPECIES: flagellar motor switch protein FliM [unclassified Butyrivibrio]SDB39405.1 flagellar motor switch protein FliM [Butyrivibrio sp. INlla16]SEK44364.1 flagellar motor switch protein FliM [Butyrivibrio sp. ob235]